MAATAKKAGIIKKKRWVMIKAPKLFNEQIIGESYVGEAKELLGRKVTVSLMNLTGDPQKQTINVSFNITGISEDGSVETAFCGYKLMSVVVKKLVRRRRDKITDSFVVQSADKTLVRVKPLLVTRGKASGSSLTSMRKLLRAYVAFAISKSTRDDLISAVVQKHLQRNVVQQLKHLYPVGACEIRVLEFLPPEKAKEVGLRITLPPENLPDFSVKREAPKKKVEQEEPVQEEEKADSEE